MANDKKKWLLILLWFLLLSVIFVIGLESVEVDDLCDRDGSFLKRVSGEWICSSFLDTNATTECDNDQVLLGNGTCYSISGIGGGNGTFDLNVTNGTSPITITDSEILTVSGGDNIYVQASGNVITINGKAEDDPKYSDDNDSIIHDGNTTWVQGLCYNTDAEINALGYIKTNGSVCQSGTYLNADGCTIPNGTTYDLTPYTLQDAAESAYFNVTKGQNLTEPVNFSRAIYVDVVYYGSACEYWNGSAVLSRNPCDI